MKKDISKGLVWKKGCIHIHTPASDDFGYESIRASESESEKKKQERYEKMKKIYDQNREVSPEELIKNLIENDYDFAIISDHNSFTWIPKLRDALDSLKKDNDEIEFAIFPGIELATKDGYHVEIVFDPDTSKETLDELMIGLRLRGIEGKSGKNFEWDNNSENNTKIWKDFDDIKSYLDKIRNLEYIVIFPHIRGDSGIHKLSIDSRNKIYSSLKSLYGITTSDLLSEIGIKSIKNEIPLKLVPLVITSDYHGRRDETLRPTWIRFEDMSIQSLKQATYDPNSRISLSKPSSVTYPYIESLYCPGSYFGDIELWFNPHINTFIGGRGSGKSSILEFLFFVFKKVDSMLESSNRLFKDKAKKIISKLNCLIGRDSQISIVIKNFNEKYSDIKITRNFKFFSVDPNQNLDDTQIAEILTAPLKFTNAGEILPPSLCYDLKSDLCEMYFQEEFRCVTNLPNYPLTILDIYLRTYEQFQVSELKSSLNELRDLINQKQIELKNLYTKNGEIRIVEEKDYNEQLSELKHNLKSFELIFQQKSSDEEREFQKKHENWMILTEKKKKNEEITKRVLRKIDDLKGILLIKEKINDFNAHVTEEEKPLPIKKDFVKESTKIYGLLEDLNELMSNFTTDLTKIKSSLKDRLKSLNSKWDKSFEVHEQEYEEFQKKSEERAKLHDKINRLKHDISVLENKKEANTQNITNILNLEMEIKLKQQELQKGWKRYINKRKNAMNHLNYDLKGDHYNHLTFKFSYYWDYLEILKNKTDRIMEKYLKKICEQFSGNEFVKILEISQNKEQLDNNERDLFRRFDNLGLTDKTKKKLFQLKPHEEVPDSIRGLFDEDLMEIERSGIKEQIIIQIIKDESSELASDIDKVSPGEQHRNLLLLSLINKNIPLLIDQPEDHLDFHIKNNLPDLLISERFNRQFFIVTHFQNIPVLADSEKIFFLEEKYDTEINQMTTQINSGAFESMAEFIIELEGGPEAILQRKERYSAFIDVLKN